MGKILFCFLLLIGFNANAQIYGRDHIEIATPQGRLTISVVHGGKGEDNYFNVRMNDRDFDKIYGNEIRFDEDMNAQGQVARLLIYDSEGGFSAPSSLLLYDFRKKPSLIFPIGDGGLDAGEVKWLADGVLLRIYGASYKGRWYKFNGKRLVPVISN